MGDLYRVNLSNLPNSERKKYKQQINQVSEDIFDSNQPGEIIVFWTDPKNISEILNLPTGCTITKY